jgi:hypothetical protein
MTEKKDTRFKPGQSGNPKGKPPGVGEVGRLRMAIAEHIPEIIEQLVEASKGGDIQASRLLLERVFPPIKAVEQAQEIDMPENGSLTDKANAMLIAAASGKLAPGQASQMISALGTIAKLVETTELIERIAKLEEANAKS